jgi:hypothetical protein
MKKSSSIYNTQFTSFEESAPENTGKAFLQSEKPSAIKDVTP